MNIVDKPSPNFNTGRKGYKPEAIVIHIMEGSLAGTDSWFANPQSKVSAHYGIGKSGAVHRYVQEKDIAWHAGRVSTPSWRQIRKGNGGLYINPNYYTVGIEHEGNVNSEWPEPMYKASSEMIREISLRWQIPLDRDHIVGHHEIYAVKTCPGTKVDLNRLIDLAKGTVTVDPPAIVPRIAIAGTVVTRARLHLRRTPDRSQSPLTTINANASLNYSGYTDEGENISGNSTWYYTDHGQWFWSGAVVS